MKVTEGTFCGVNGVELFYRKILASSQTAKGTVIAVHGHGDHSGGMQNVIEKLTENGYHLYALDLRGHGKSPGIRGFIRKWEEYRGDLHALRELAAEEAAGLPVYVMGHSMGGLIGAEYSLFHSHGISGLVLIAFQPYPMK